MTEAKTAPDFSGWGCPAPLKNYPTIVMGHGSGGKMTSDLIEHLFAPQLNNHWLAERGDAAVLNVQQGQIAFTTDTFVVSPLLFPGGTIGELAINGTVNDLAMRGAAPHYLSAGFILEEGLPMEDLARIVGSMAIACEVADVRIVTGDTKVVNKGHGDGLYINTSGVGLIPEGVDIAPQNAAPGDVVIVSSTVGDHGMAIMSVRHGLTFETQIVSDTAALNGLVAEMLAASGNIHCLRDATRGGLAASLNELASASGVGIIFEESAVPVTPAVHAACEMLGFDPLYVANEGTLIAIVPAEDASVVLEAMQAHPLGQQAKVIGKVVDAHHGLVVARTGIGGSRVVDLPAGELLPRIC